MDVYSYLNLFCDLSGIRVRIFDCRTEEIIFDKTEKECEGALIYDLEEAELDSYEIGGVDLYRDGSWIVVELNIETDDPDE